MNDQRRTFNLRRQFLGFSGFFFFHGGRERPPLTFSHFDVMNANDMYINKYAYISMDMPICQWEPIMESETNKNTNVNESCFFDCLGFPLLFTTI